MNSKRPKTIIAIASLLMATQFADAQNLSQGLTLYLPFSGNANDASGNGNNGIVTSATLTADQNGNPNSAYYFDGIDDQIVVPHNTMLNPVPDSGFSMTARVNMQGFYNGFCYNNNIVNKGSNLSSSPVGYYGLISTQTMIADCNFEDTTNHNFRFDFNGNGNALGTQLNATINNQPHVQLNQWDCLVGVFKGDTSYMYVNGVLRYKINTTSKPGNTEDVAIGYDKYGAASAYPFWFKGVIDEIRLYNRALTMEEIDLYCSNETTSAQDLAKNSVKTIIYPNPASEATTLTIDMPAKTNLLIQVLDMSAKVVKEVVNESVTSGVQNFTIGTENLSSGIYTIRVQTKFGTEMKRLTVVK